MVTLDILETQALPVSQVALGKPGLKEMPERTEPRESRDPLVLQEREDLQDRLDF